MIVECHQFTNTINLLPTIKSGDSITKVVILQQYNLQNDHLSIQPIKHYNLHTELSSMIQPTSIKQTHNHHAKLKPLKLCFVDVKQNKKPTLQTQKIPMTPLVQACTISHYLLFSLLSPQLLHIVHKLLFPSQQFFLPFPQLTFPFEALVKMSCCRISAT